jgi:hypothetical protein
MELALDGRRLRPLATLPERPTLGDLSEGAALGAGAHYLVAALRAVENGPARFAVARFAVEAGATSEPLVYCASPAGTYYGASGELLLDFASDGFEPGVNGAVLVRARERDSKEPPREALLRDRGPRLVHGIAPGDWSIELSSLGPGDRPLAGELAHHRCELTMNEAAAP